MVSEAYDTMVRAIEDFLREGNRIQEGWALGDWIICMEQIPFAPELANRQRYGFITPEPTVPLHRLIGLMDIVDTDLRSCNE